MTSLPSGAEGRDARQPREGHTAKRGVGLSPASRGEMIFCITSKEDHGMDVRSELYATVQALVADGKGILAADESGPTIAKRFKAIGVESTEEARRAWRSLALSAPGLAQFISGVILYEETLLQKGDDGTPLPELAARAGI